MGSGNLQKWGQEGGQASNAKQEVALASSACAMHSAHWREEGDDWQSQSAGPIAGPPGKAQVASPFSFLIFPISFCFLFPEVCFDSI